MTSPRRLLVLDDDPTGSQCVANVDVVLEPDAITTATALQAPRSTCFVLTNSRALDETDAVELNRRTLSEIIAAGIDPTDIRIVSRSDSTLRGHVIAEPEALADVLDEHGQEVDGILLCPAMLEAGRFTEGGTHYATVRGEAMRVAETDFAADATYGYSNSDLAAFLEERSGGKVKAGDVLKVSLEDIRDGGIERVVNILGEASKRRWIVLDATEYSDMETVVQAVNRLEDQGRVFLTRCAPSFVRPLTGQHGASVLAPGDIAIASGRQPHGLVVVGSHVGLTTRQLNVVQTRSGLKEFEIQVPKLLNVASRSAHIREISSKVREGLRHHDVVLYTSRELVSTDDPAESLSIARTVSDAVVAVVQAIRDVRPAWVVAKGGITSHEVAVKGLGVRRAEVTGQFFPGQISLFTPREAPDEVRGMPYVVFPGNVGNEDALADVIDRLIAATPVGNNTDTIEGAES